MNWKAGRNSSHIGYYVLSVDFAHPEIGLAAEPQTAFFSYSREDSEFALGLAEKLKAAGANVWMDQLDLVGGQRWAQTVQGALEKCPLLLIVLSPSSVSSTNTMDEVTFALDEKKTVVPVLLHDCKIPYRLRSLHHIDFRRDHARGLKAVLKALGVEPQAPAAGSTADSAVPKDAAADVTDAEKREQAAELQRLMREEKRATDQARLEAQAREREAAEEKAQQDELERRRIAAENERLEEERRRIAAEQIQLDDERKQAAAEKVRLEQLLREHRAATEKSKEMELERQALATEKDRLEQERQRLSTEQARLDEARHQAAAEQARLELERQHKAADRAQKTGVKPAVPEGVYFDPETRLMWTIQDNGKDIAWHDANQYAGQLSLGGYSDWRLPTIDELEKLYDSLNPSALKIRKPFRLTDYLVWSSTEGRSGSAWGFLFGSGMRHPSRPYDSSHGRALCVRRSKKWFG